MGVFLLMVFPPLQGIMIILIRARVITPVQSISRFGNGALILLVFLNNSIPALLSFAYPFIIVKLNWTPPLSTSRRRFLLNSYTLLCAFLVGFFGLGVTLSTGWMLGGRALLLNLLGGAWVHGPIEIIAILLCVSEPLRLAKREIQDDIELNLMRDRKLLVICLLLLFLSAGIEVVTGV